MPLPIHFSLPIAGQSVAATPPTTGSATAAKPPGHEITTFDPAADAAAVAALADACRSEAGPQAGHFVPAGLLGELASRPGRLVQAWLAWPEEHDRRSTSGGPAFAETCAGPLGLVALVVATGAAGPRASIGWLLVHPAARRRGIAGSLVETAVRAAAAAGARTVSAETLPTWPAAVAFWRAAGFRERRPP